LTYKSVSEVAPVLASKYDGPTYEREGAGGKKFTYIPWTASIKALDEVFGPFGWSMTQPSVVCAEGQWTVSVGVTVYVQDDETGAVIEKTVGGVGSAPARDDNSAKSALSDALSKAVKLLGNRFGFFLSEKGGAPTTTNYKAEVKVTGSLGARPSPKQLGVLTKAGYSEEQVAAMPFKDWKACIDAIFAKEELPIAPAGKVKVAAAPRRSAPAEPDDLDAMFNEEGQAFGY
jgi:hypothetical protein